MDQRARHPGVEAGQPLDDGGGVGREPGLGDQGEDAAASLVGLGRQQVEGGLGRDQRHQPQRLRRQLRAAGRHRGQHRVEQPGVAQGPDQLVAQLAGRGPPHQLRQLGQRRQRGVGDEVVPQLDQEEPAARAPAPGRARPPPAGARPAARHRRPALSAPRWRAARPGPRRAPPARRWARAAGAAGTARRSRPARGLPSPRARRTPSGSGLSSSGREPLHGGEADPLELPLAQQRDHVVFLLPDADVADGEDLQEGRAARSTARRAGR